MTLQSWLSILLPMAILQIIAGIAAVFSMFVSLKEMKIQMKADKEELQRQIKNLEDHDSISKSDLGGINTQINSLSTSLGEIKGQLSMLIRHEPPR